MKMLSIVVGLGFILLYFVDAALKISPFGVETGLNIELLIHSGIRFFTGFIILGIGVFYEHVIKFKMAFYIVLALVLADDVMDYYRDVDSFHTEMMIHGIYLLLWGAATGYAFIKYWKAKTDRVR